MSGPAPEVRRQRQARRVTLYPGEIRCGDARIDCETVDLSASGAKIRLLEPFECSSPITLTIDVGTFEGEVVWQHEEFVGINYKTKQLGPRDAARSGDAGSGSMPTRRLISPGRSRSVDSHRLAEPAEEFDPRAIVRVMWRQRLVLLKMVAFVTGMAVLFVLLISPRYTAEALVMIETRDVQVVEIEQVLPAMTVDIAMIETQVHILRSRHLAGKVIDRMGLLDDPEFKSWLQSTYFNLAKYVNPLRYIPWDWFGESRGGAQDTGRSEQLKAQRERDIVVEEFLSNLTVSPQGVSYVIAIRYEFGDPRKAADVANAIAELYLDDQLEAKFDATRRANTWLHGRLAELQQQVINAEHAVEVFREASVTIKNLKEQETKLLQKGREASAKYGDKHPTMINIRTELGNLRRRMDLEVNSVLQGFERDVASQSPRVAGRGGDLTILRGQLAEPELRLRQLQRESVASRALYETFLARFRETSEQEGLQQPDARIISPASIPLEPSYPRPARTVGLAFVGSIALGILIILIGERFRRGFQSAQELEHLSGLPVLGQVPILPELAKGIANLSMETDGAPVFREAIRSIRARLSLLESETPPKVLLITSALPQEGKTVLAAALALQSAKAGQKCLLIDCDYRRPQLHKWVGLPDRPGLDDALAGTSTLDEIIVTEPTSGLAFIASGSGKPETTELLAQGIDDFLQRLRPQYELIVIDSPPVMIVSDANKLSRVVDATVYVVGWNSTRRETALAGLKHLVEDGAKLAGVVLTRVDTKEYARLGLADSDQYAAEYNAYY